MSAETAVLVVVALAVISVVAMWVNVLRGRSGGTETGGDVPKRYRDLLDAQADETRRQLAERDRRDAERDRKDAKRDEDILVLREWVSELCAQAIERGDRPITEYEIRRKLGLVGPHIAASSGPVTDSRKLVEVLANKFTLAEMQSLSFDMGVPWEEIPGAITRSKAEGLASWMKNRNRLEDLHAAVRRARPQEFPA